jgi:hypothetical protein
MTEPRLEELRGKTYPDTLREQLRALEVDEHLQRFRRSRQALAADPYLPLLSFLATRKTHERPKWPLPTGRVATICSTSSDPIRYTVSTGATR